MNRTDSKYLRLLHKILTEGVIKGDRTGTGTKSIFHHTLEMDMADGFPLLTTKKMFTKGILHELLWLLNGDTNIKYLVENGVHIWTGDAYKKFRNNVMEKCKAETKLPPVEYLSKNADLLSKEEFTEKIKTDEAFAKEWGELGPIYGKQWVGWGSYEDKFEYIDNGKDEPVGARMSYDGINQIQNAIDMLNNNPDGRRIMVSAWNVGEISKMTLPPCHWAFELYTEELTWQERMDICDNKEKGNITPFTEIIIHAQLDYWGVPKRKLSLKWHQRSVDTGLGLPFNIASYGFLLHMFAQQVNMIPDKLIGDLTNVHIYLNHLEALEGQLDRKGGDLPTLKLNKAKDIFSYSFDDFEICDYKPDLKITMALSN
tara:strand:+ start:16199 stop:17311 length:1113 start_codon:yes stop_codon:yes gene_type:complete